jgi:hypothetical protein
VADVLKDYGYAIRMMLCKECGALIGFRCGPLSAERRSNAQ